MSDPTCCGVFVRHGFAGDLCNDLEQLPQQVTVTNQGLLIVIKSLQLLHGISEFPEIRSNHRKATTGLVLARPCSVAALKVARQGSLHIARHARAGDQEYFVFTHTSNLYAVSHRRVQATRPAPSVFSGPCARRSAAEA